MAIITPPNSNAPNRPNSGNSSNSVTYNNNNNNMVTITIRFTKPCLIAFAVIASYSILLLAQTTYTTEQNQSRYQHDATTPELLAKSTSTTSSSYPPTTSKGRGYFNHDRSSNHSKQQERNEFHLDQDKVKVENSVSSPLSYYHCQSSNYGEKNYAQHELLLLHGAAFTKEDWMSSGILKSFCTNISSSDSLSVTAIDLSVQATAQDLFSSFEALTKKGILSGKPLAIISPSASGKAMMELGRLYSHDGHSSNNSHSKKKKNESFLVRMVRGWIPVATFAALQVKEEDIHSYEEAMIPILAIHGDQDARGKKVTERLVKVVSGSKGVELKGRHPCYLDSPMEFVKTVLNFLRDL